MQQLKNLTKRILKIHPKSNLTPLRDIIQLGTKVHGYFIPENFLNSSSLCYCVGAGEDISFDTELVHIISAAMWSSWIRHLRASITLIF